jgi:hypothetical protein
MSKANGYLPMRAKPRGAYRRKSEKRSFRSARGHARHQFKETSREDTSIANRPNPWALAATMVAIVLLLMAVVVVVSIILM